MNDRVRIADLPTSTNVDKDSYMLVERPGIGTGTYKTTLGDIQEAITVRARIEQVDKLVTIIIKDITGEYVSEFLIPTAKIVDNGDNTITITLTDTDGVTESTVVSKVVMDPYPIEDSPNLVSSGNVWTIVRDQHAEAERITEVEQDMADTVAKMQELLADFAELQKETDTRLENMEESVARSLEVEHDQEIDYPYSVGGGVRYNSLLEAILVSHVKGTHVKLFSSATTRRVSVPENVDFILDLNGYTLNFIGPEPGPEGFETNGFELLEGSNVTIKNGKLKFDSGDIYPVPWLAEDGQPILTESGEEVLAEEKFLEIIFIPMLTEDGQNILTEDDQELLADEYYTGSLDTGIQNYSNLTLDNVTVEGDSDIYHVITSGYGDLILQNNTSVIAQEDNTSLKIFYGSDAKYDDPGAFATVADETTTLQGKIQFGKDGRATPYNFKTKSWITVPESMEVETELLTIPCEWFNNGDGTKTLKYTGI